MAQNNDTTVGLYINGKQAEQTLAILREKAESLGKQLEEAVRNGDTALQKKLKKSIKDVNQTINQMQASTKNVADVMARLDRATPHELRKTLTTLQQQLKHIERGTPAWDAHVAKIRTVKAEIDKVNAEMKQSESLLVRMRNGIQNWVAMAAGAVASLTGVVAAGKKANGELTFMSYSLEKAGIETIADIEFKLYVYDSDSWDDYLESGLISVKTSAAETYEYVYDESGEVIYEGNDIKLVAKGLMDSSDWGPQILIYAVNNGTQPVTVSAEDVSVNDFMVSAYFVATMLPGKHVIDTMTFLDSSLEDNDIEKIESAEMSFCIYNADTWDTIANTDPVTLYFSE